MYRIGNVTRLIHTLAICVCDHTLSGLETSARYSPECFAQGSFWLLSISFGGHKRSDISQDEHNQAPLDNNIVDVCAKMKTPPGVGCSGLRVLASCISFGE